MPRKFGGHALRKQALHRQRQQPTTTRTLNVAREDELGMSRLTRHSTEPIENQPTDVSNDGLLPCMSASLRCSGAATA